MSLVAWARAAMRALWARRKAASRLRLAIWRAVSCGAAADVTAAACSAVTSCGGSSVIDPVTIAVSGGAVAPFQPPGQRQLPQASAAPVRLEALRLWHLPAQQTKPNCRAAPPQ